MKRIKLIVEEAGGVERQAWPITQGIPFEDRELQRDAPVRIVTETGEQLAVQTLCLTTWDKELKYVKWLLIDFQVDLEPHEKKEVFLEYGSSLTPVESEYTVKVENTGECTRIDTEVMRVELRYGDPDFFGSCQVKTSEGWLDLVKSRTGLYLYMRDQRGTLYDSHRAAPYPCISVEDSGPLRVSVSVKGFHASEDGRRFCPYNLRMHFYAGRSDIRFYHTFTFDQNPEQIELSEIGLHFDFDLGHPTRIAFGGEAKSHWAKKFEHGQFIQNSDRGYSVRVDDVEVGKGRKTNGWASLTGDAGSVLAAVRDLWQEYPKGITVDQDSIDIQIWPLAYEQTLKFSTPYKETAVRFTRQILENRDEAEFKRVLDENPTAPLNLKSLGAFTPEEIQWTEEMVAKYAADRPASYNDTGVNNGFGAAKTTEFWMRFSEKPVSDKSAEDFAVCVQEPVIAPAEPAYSSATGALRFVAPKDAERFPAAEKWFEELFERIVVEPRQKLRSYGMIDYGDLICSHSPSPSAIWTIFKNEPDIIERMKHCARSYNNEANDQLYALWGFFTHTSQRKYFLAAEAYGKHMADVDIFHEGHRKGLIHYHNCHHWTGSGSPSHTCMAGLMLQYYLTGNRRILDVCREIADFFLNQQEPCGIYSNRFSQLVREYTTPLADLLEFYQATWEHRYGELARRSIKWLLMAMPEPGCFPKSLYTAGERGDEAVVEQKGWHLRQAGGMTPQLLYDAVKVFGESDAIYKKALLAMAHRYLYGPEDPVWAPLKIGDKEILRPDPFMNVSLIAYAYEISGDSVYAAFCRMYMCDWFVKMAEDITTRTRLNRPGIFTYVCWGSLVPSLMAAVHQAEKKLGRDEIDRHEREYIQWVTDEFGDRKIESVTTPESLERRSIGRIQGC